MITPYIKRTKALHDSGFGCLEVGYCEVKDSVIIHKKVIGKSSDHIWRCPIETLVKRIKFSPEINVNMDLTKGGYVRLFVNHSKEELRWQTEEFPLSTMTLVMMPIRRGKIRWDKTFGEEFDEFLESATKTAGRICAYPFRKIMKLFNWIKRRLQRDKSMEKKRKEFEKEVNKDNGKSKVR